MKRNKVNFVFTKSWGSIKKGTKGVYRKSFARSLQDVRKVGEIVTDKPKAKPKVVKPAQDKVEPKVKAKETK